MTLPRWDPDFEILAEAASGVPVFFLADDDEEIRRVLALADEIGFRPSSWGGGGLGAGGRAGGTGRACPRLGGLPRPTELEAGGERGGSGRRAGSG
jgi:hypothetical protein